MLNVGQIIVADTMLAVDRFTLCKTIGTKTFTPPDIKIIANAAMMEDAMIETIGAEMMTGIIMTIDAMAKQTMAEVIGITQEMVQIDIKAMVLTTVGMIRVDMTAAVIIKAVKTKVEMAKVMAATKWI